MRLFFATSPERRLELPWACRAQATSRHKVRETQKQKVAACVFIGDAEEEPGDKCSAAKRATL